MEYYHPREQNQETSSSSSPDPTIRFRNPQSLSPQSRAETYEESKSDFKQPVLREIQNLPQPEIKNIKAQWALPKSYPLDAVLIENFSTLSNKLQGLSKTAATSIESILQDLEKLAAQLQFSSEPKAQSKAPLNMEFFKMHFSLIKKSCAHLTERIES